MLWHWNHFLCLPACGALTPGSQTGEPLYFLLRPFYDHGDLAVDLFFVLSGFVFFWLYERKIYEGRVTAPDFAVLRIARLYPLFFAALIIVAALQWVYFHQVGSFFIYEKNTPIHFIENLFMVNAGGSFNGPVWSITDEIAAYVVFFTVAKLKLTVRHAWVLPAMVVLGLLLEPINVGLSRAISGFFMGGLSYRLFRLIATSKKQRLYARILFGAAISGWLLVAFFSYVPNHMAFNTRNVAISNLYFWYLLFPLTVICAAVHEHVAGGRYAVFAWLGVVSYSSYLLHFPLQLAVANLVVAGVLPQAMLMTWPALFAFYAILIPTSWLAYKLFEAPAQQLIRAAWRTHRLKLSAVGRPAE